MRTMEATVKVKDAAKVVVGEQTYTKQVFGEPKESKPEELLRDAIGFLQKEAGEKGNGVLDLLQHVTYSYDLGQRSNIRQGIVASLEGPEKAITKAVDALVKAYTAMGKTITREDARKLIPEKVSE